MQIKGILTCQTIRFFSQAETEGVMDRRSPVPLIKGLQDEYGFVQVPSKVEDLDFNKGVTFLRGYYRGAIIDKLQVYENGLLCEAAADTRIGDDFLGEVLIWAAEKHQLPVKETGVMAYISQLEVISEINVGAIFSKLKTIGTLFSEALTRYGQPVPAYEFNGLRMHYDSMATPIPRPPHFIFERRVGQVYSTNEYFTSAPLRTEDHLRVLEILEKLLSSQRPS
jgi:hypothetical protein